MGEAACVAEREYYKRKESGSLTKNPVELKENAKHLRCPAQAIRVSPGKQVDKGDERIFCYTLISIHNESLNLLNFAFYLFIYSLHTSGSKLA